MATLPSGGVSKADFCANGRSVVRGGMNYYSKLSNDEGGELFKLIKTFDASSSLINVYSPCKDIMGRREEIRLQVLH
jgi:hypothetical protein